MKQPLIRFTCRPHRARLHAVLLLAGLLCAHVVPAQVLDDFLGDEFRLLSETKQVNQFFRRFNAEERPDGSRLHPSDDLYHDPAMRREYLDMLFDRYNPDLAASLKRSFVEDVLRPGAPCYLDFHGGEWYAEVSTTFIYQGKEMNLLLFLELEQADIGSEWVFSHMYFEPFHQLFQNPEAVQPAFIHPLSHELDFMNLIKVFRNAANLEAYASRHYQPDYLTLLIYESKRGNLRFKSVNKVKFHFFQLNGWYFELSEIYRQDPNRGWLITQLSSLREGEKELLQRYIFHR